MSACEHPMHDDDCPHECEAPKVCEFACGNPVADERTNDDGRVMLVCEFCCDDWDRATKRKRDEDARECAADQKYSEWKDEGRRR